MKVNLLEKLKILLKVYCQVWKLPQKSQALAKLINPLDSTRYTEFACLLEFIKTRKLKKMDILDVSSPYMMAYILASGNRVVKTDINIKEEEFIKENKNLSFKLEDATQLSFKGNSFDLVYSISAIEHIYGKYIQSVNEMVRVTKPGGLVYLAFPVSERHIEEWIDEVIYPQQHRENNKVFFQYRFDENDVDSIINGLKDVKVIDLSVYWERKSGQYDRMIARLKKPMGNRRISFLKDAVINFISGFSLLENKPRKFDNPKQFGNVSIILEKSNGYIQK